MTQQKHQSFRIITAPHTPMDTAGELRVGSIPAMARHFTAAEIDGVFVGGTSGESMSLTVDERMALAAAWRDEADDLEIIVHVGHTSLPDARCMAQHAQSIGADAIAAMPPCFFRPASVRDLVDFCARIADAAPRTPFYYYHMPAMTGVDLPMIAFLREAEERIPTLRGIKFTHENLFDFQHCVRFADGRYEILMGRDEILLAGLALGARGAVGSTYNYAAPLYRELLRAWEKADIQKARELQGKAADLVTVLCDYRGGIVFGKAVMNLLGFDVGPCRPPLRSLDHQECAALKRALNERGFFTW